MTRERLKKITNIINIDDFYLEYESESERDNNYHYVGYGVYENNGFKETRYSFIKERVEGITICWKGNPFKLSDYICLIKR